VWDFFTRKNNVVATPLFKTDLHSHLLPGLDDGVKTFEDAETIIRLFIETGFTKAITTPHIMNDYYRNTPSGIKGKLEELKTFLAQKKISFEVQCAAEYYFDEALMDLAFSDSEILTFGDRYVLFETNPFSEPMMLNDFIFQLTTKDYKPVLAHPERYQFLQNNFARMEDLIDRGVYLQVNALSFTGYYSKAIQKIANELVENNMVRFVGSDCHTVQHARLLQAAVENKYFKKALELPLLNYSI
jgi:protein-tyrosine phosphatase